MPQKVQKVVNLKRSTCGSKGHGPSIFIYGAKGRVVRELHIVICGILGGFPDYCRASWNVGCVVGRRDQDRSGGYRDVRGCKSPHLRPDTRLAVDGDSHAPEIGRASRQQAVQRSAGASPRDASLIQDEGGKCSIGSNL
jgi:hypothetical protein